MKRDLPLNMSFQKKNLILLLAGLVTFNSCLKKEEKTESIQTDSLTTIKEEEALVDPLPSWNNTKSKERIINFVKTVTAEGTTEYIPPQDRIATFDNDGTLWSEKPTYFQVEFVLYRIKQLAPWHPEWKKDKLIQAAIKRDLKKLREKYGAEGLGKLMAIAQSGMTTDEFEKIVRNWINKAKHPISGKLYSEMVFQPMLELIDYLHDNDFKVYIVSGGGIDFMRAWTEEVYDIPGDRVLGSLTHLQYKKVKGKPVLIKSPEILFVNDQAGKPKTIHRFIGKKPIISFGNSDGDLQMLEWCASSKYMNLQAFIHHTDAKREWAYDRNSSTGTLSIGLDAAANRGWLVVDMKNDWKVIHSYEVLP